MTSNESVQFHMRFVSEKHKELNNSLDELTKALVSENVKSKNSKAEISLTKATDLKASISQQDCPPWLPPLIQCLQYYKTGTWKSANVIGYLVENLIVIKQHKWVFENSSDAAFDFDSIFQHYKSQSRLSELFDQIIEILEKIQDSGEVDSVSMMSALGKVIATLKQNKEGSYFSINSAWSFLVSFLKNYMWAELSKIPVLGTAMGALEKTIKDTNEEMFKVHNEVQKEMKTVVESEVKGLAKKSDFSFVGYDKSGYQLPRLENNSEINEKI